MLTLPCLQVGSHQSWRAGSAGCRMVRKWVVATEAEEEESSSSEESGDEEDQQLQAEADAEADASEEVLICWHGPVPP